MKQKIYKLISMVLAVALIVSCCTVTLSVTAEDTAKEPITYYVSPDADVEKANGEFNTPYATIGDVIVAANETGYGAGDTVNVKLIKTTNMEEDGTIKHLYHSWGTIIPYAFKLSISSYVNPDDANYKTIIDMNRTVSFEGDIAFEDVILAWGSGWPTFNFKAHSVSFGSKIELWDAYKASNFVTAWSTSNIPNELNFYFQKLPSTLYLGGYDSTVTFKKINVTLDGGFSGGFKLGDLSADRAVTTFNGTFNYNLKSASSLSFSDGKGTVAFTSNFAAQLINSTGNASLTDNAVTYFSGKKIKDTDTTVPYYVINNSFGDCAIEFTETAGKFKLNLDASKYWNIRLVNADESVVVYPDENNCVTIPESGVYTLKAGDVVTYYVKPDADSSIATGERDKPFVMVEDAIIAANKIYGAGDIVNLKLIKTTTTSDDETVSEVAHSWYSGSSKNKLTAYAYTLNISSESADDKATLHAVGNVGLNGKTNFENVILSFGSVFFVLHNNNTTLGKGVEYIGTPTFTTTWGSESKTDVDYYFESLPADLRIGGRWNKGHKYTNINLTLNGSAISNTLTFGDADGSGYNIFQGVLNFNIKNAASVGFSGSKYYAVEGFAANIINSTGVDAISSNALTYFSGKKISTYDSGTETYTATANVVPHYVINNRHGADAIESTSTAGKFKVNLNPDEYSYIALQNNAGACVEPNSEGYITLTESGEYTLKAVKEVTYYVSAEGDDDNGDGSAEKPYKTVAKAVAVANTKNYGAGVIVNLKAIGTITWGVADAYPYTLKVTSADVVNLASVSVGTVTGDLVFDDIKVTNSSRILLYGYNLTFGEGVNNTSSNISIELADAGQTVTKTQTVIINNAYKSSMVIGANHNNGSTWNKDVNVVVNNPEAVLTSISFQTYWGGNKTIKGNLNFIFNNIKSATFGTPNGTSPAPRDYSTVVNGAVQLVVPETATITNKANLSTNWAISKGYKYHEVVKATGVKADITQTATAGKYLVDIDTGLYSNIQLVNNADETKKSDLEDGTVIASEPGEYTLKATKDTSATCTYYVSPNGSDTADGRTADTALESINAAIIAATNDGYGAGNTVLIKLIKVDDLRNKWFSASNIPSDNMKRLATHDFKINISSYTDKAILSASTHLSLGGNTEFENVILGFSTSGETYLNFLNNNVSIGQGVEYIENSKLAFATSWAGTPPQEMNYYFESIPKDLYLGGNWSGQKFNNINITLNNGFSGNIFLGERGYNSNSTTTFDGILNFNVMDAKKLGLYSTNYGPVVFTENFVMQMINSSGVEAVSTNAINYIGDKIVKDTTDTTVPYYVINNNTGDKEAISFTETAGKYQLNIDAKIYDVKVLNSSKEDITATVLTNDGCIDLVSAGLVSDTFTVIALNQNGSVDENGYVVFDICDLVKADENAVSADAIAYIRKELLNK